MTGLVLDAFGGPGGASEGMRLLGLGNAVPPVLAAHCVAAVAGLSITTEGAAA